MSKFLRFIVSGVTAAGVELCVFVAITAITGGGRSWIIIAQITSFLCGFVVSFTLNRYWAFAVTGRVGTMFAQYSVLAAVNLVLTGILIDVLTSTLHIPALVSKVVVIGCVAAWNYVIFNKIIFKSNTTV